MCFDVPNVSGFLAWSLVPGNGCAGTLASEGLRDHCDAAEGAALVLRGVATLRRCHAAGISSRLRDFATLRRCHAAGVSSRLRDAATLPRRWGLLASSRRCNAATLPRRWGLLASSRLRGAVTLRRCDAAGGAARVFAVSRRCDAAGGCSRLRVFGMKYWNPPCALNGNFTISSSWWNRKHAEVAAMGLIPMPSNLFTTLSRALPHVCSYSRNTCGMALCLPLSLSATRIAHGYSLGRCQSLHREAFTQKTWTQSCYTEEPLHRTAFTDRGFYTQKPLHREVFTQRSFYT